jgi:hypothetical protein
MPRWEKEIIASDEAMFAAEDHSYIIDEDMNDLDFNDGSDNDEVLDD